MKQVVAIGVLLLILIRHGQAQHTFLKSLSFDYGRGQTLKHSSKIFFDIPNGSYDLRMDMAFQTRGNQVWHQLYRYPRIGLGTMFLDYGNPDVLGRTFAIYGFIDQAYLRKGKLSLWGRFDHGVAIHSKIYHPVHNPQNGAISSRFNLHASLGLRAEFQLSHTIQLRLGGYFSHQSNSRVTVPNLGLNTLKWLAGLSYTFDKPKQKQTSAISQFRPSEFDLPKWNFIPRIGLGLKEEIAFNGPKYPVYSISLQVSRNVKKKRRYLMGVESGWDMATRAFKVDQEIQSNEAKFHVFNPSVSIGHEYLFGRIGLLTEVNIYLRQTFIRKNKWASRLGTNFYLQSPFVKPSKDKLFIGFYIRSHVVVADYLEFGLGYQF